MQFSNGNKLQCEKLVFPTHHCQAAEQVPIVCDRKQTASRISFNRRGNLFANPIRQPWNHSPSPSPGNDSHISSKARPALLRSGIQTVEFHATRFFPLTRVRLPALVTHCYEIIFADWQCAGYITRRGIAFSSCFFASAGAILCSLSECIRSPHLCRLSMSDTLAPMTRIGLL
jgi:hypothetical protein